ncbi:hypothetical protein JCM8547_006012 [Rhodosporidiobolus lusitaniae]
MLARTALRRALLVHTNKRRCLSSSFSDSLQPTSPPNDGPHPPYNLLFFGADTFSCEVFERVHEARQDLLDHITVVTPPDQKAGRKNREVHRPPLRILAEELDVHSIALPKTLLKGWHPPDLFLPPSTSPLSTPPSPRNLLLTASFGHLIPSALLSLFPLLNALNVHPSLLPKYRGAAPIQHGIVNGDADEGGSGMGVTVQELSRGKFDQGRILGQTGVDVPSGSDFATLEPILARAGGDLLVSILQNLADEQASAFPQDPARATLAPKLHKSFARVDWSSKSPVEALRLQRGIGHQVPLWTTYIPPSASPSASSASSQLQLRLSPSPSPLPPTLALSSPGSVALDPTSKAVVVRCRDGNEGVELDKVKREGGKWIKARDWWNALKRREGLVLA